MSAGVPKVNLYRNISLSFVLFAIIILAAVFLFFYRQGTVIVYGKESDIEINIKVEVKENPEKDELSEKNVIAGSLSQETRQADGEFKTLSTKTADQGIVGSVKIVNEAGHNQILVPTTQLQADNGAIVRTSRKVVIPSGGSVEVEVFPKDPQSFRPIDPGRLTIIKLGVGLQDLVYGIAEAPITDELKEINFLAESDIFNARQQLKEEILSELGQENNNQPTLYHIELTDIETIPKINEETEKFTLKAKAIIYKLIYDKDQLQSLLIANASNLDLKGFSVGQTKWQDAQSHIEELDFGGNVLIETNYNLKTKINPDHDLLKKENFTGKSREEISSYLVASDFVDDWEVHISPYWRKNLPNNPAKIKVITR